MCCISCLTPRGVRVTANGCLYHVDILSALRWYGGRWPSAKEVCKMSAKGKTYVVKGGDMLHFLLLPKLREM